MNKNIHILIFFLLIYMSNFAYGQDSIFLYDSNNIRPEIKLIADSIGESNEIHDKAIYFGGIRTKQYDRFDKLLNNATSDELIELMNHPKPSIRGYTFWALAKRHYKDLEDIFIKHANDEEIVCWIQGCIRMKIPVIDYMNWVVEPGMVDTKCKKLDNRNHILDEYRIKKR